MSEPGHNASARLKSIVERIENLEAEKRNAAEMISDVYKEAKAAGYDVKALRKLIHDRRKSADEVEELAILVETYRTAIEGIADLPLGRAALERVGAGV